MAKRKRIRPANRDYIELKKRSYTWGSKEGSEERAGLLKVIPNHIKAFYPYGMFKVKWNKDRLGIDEDFIRSLNPNSKILEIGAGSGRLTAHLMKEGRINPKNYEILDRVYMDGEMPYMKRRIHHLINKPGGITVTGGDMLTHDYPKNAYDHILVPESLIGATDSIYGKHHSGREDSRPLIALINKLAPAIKEGGSIRISRVWDNTKKDMNDRFAMQWEGIKKILRLMIPYQAG